MKRLLLALALTVLVLVGGVGATSLTFQGSGDYASRVAFVNVTLPGAAGPTTVSQSYTRSDTGGNNYIGVYEGGTSGTQEAGRCVILPNPYSTTYAAATEVGYTAVSSQGPRVVLLDSSLSALSTSGSGTPRSAPTRLEVKVVGGTAYYYGNGVLYSSSAVTQNPSYVGFCQWATWGGAQGGSGWTYYDDYVYGDEEDTTILGMPEPGMYYIKKDIVNPAATGFYNVSGSLMSSTVFTSTFGRSNISGEALTSQPVYLINRDTGTVYETEHTGYASTGAVTWHVVNLTGTSAPYGWYQTKLGTTVSDTLVYIANGANIYFDRDEYSAGDTANISYLIDSSYYDTSTYTYSIKIVDVYGSVIDSQNIATASGTVTYTWTPDNTQGVYYAEIIGTPTAGGNDVLYNYDYATLSAYFAVTGYVHNAETEQPVSGAFVNASQGNIRSNATSGYDGNYTVSGFLSGVLFGMNTTATNHQPYWNNFTPITSHTLRINVTLIPSSPTKTDITLGGVCRDTIYGRPIPACSVDLWNVTAGQYWTKTANTVGFYNATMLTENNRYGIEGMKLRYRNSTIYEKVAVVSS